MNITFLQCQNISAVRGTFFSDDNRGIVGKEE